MIIVLVINGQERTFNESQVDRVAIERELVVERATDRQILDLVTVLAGVEALPDGDYDVRRPEADSILVAPKAVYGE